MKSKWLVKDTDGQTVVVVANAWERSGNGLEFFIDGRSVAHFLRYAFFYELLGEEPSPPTPGAKQENK